MKKADKLRKISQAKFDKLIVDDAAVISEVETALDEAAALGRFECTCKITVDSRTAERIVKKFQHDEGINIFYSKDKNLFSLNWQNEI